MKRSVGIILFILSVLFGSAGYAAQIKLYADSWEPYNYSENGQVVGIATDLVRATFQRANLTCDISIQPWKRAYQNTQRIPYTGLYVVNKTVARTPLFKWVGPLFESNVYLFRLKNRDDIQIDSIGDLAPYRIGVLRGGSVQSFLLKEGVPPSILDLHSHAGLHLNKLFAGRDDLVPGDEVDFLYQAKKLGRSVSELERAYKLYPSEYYLAINPETPDEVVDRLQSALDELIEEGYRQRLMEQLLQSL